MDLPESTSPRNAAERRVYFEKLENFGCGSLWESGLLSCSGTFAHVFFLCSTHHSSPLTIPLHFSFTSMTDLSETPSALTLSVITSHTRLLCFLENVAEILHLIILIFFPTSSKITVHSASVNFRFLVRFAGEEATFSDVFSRHKGYHHGNCLCGELAVG